MAVEKRIKILSESEISELFNPPVLNSHDQRFFFTLNDVELAQCKKIRDRTHKCMFIILLGYFKVKPIVLTPRFHQIKHDLKYVYTQVIPGSGLRPFNLNQKSRARIYQRIFKLMGYQYWDNKVHQNGLVTDLAGSSQAWTHSRFLFDRAIEYLSSKKIAMPGYTTLQDLISDVANSTCDQYVAKIGGLLPPGLAKLLSEIVNNDSVFNLNQLHQSARSFSRAELEKELIVHHHLNTWIKTINKVLKSLTLSQKNQQHFAERIDYYGARLKRQPQGNQQLYLLCYLQTRWQLALERIADGFIYHVRQTKLKAQIHAREVIYQDWQKAAKNVSKAADVLRLFIDDSIDQRQPFSDVKHRALQLLAPREMESVCLFLNDQKQSLDEAIWQYYDQCDSLRVGLIRKLFLCLNFESGESTHRLACVLAKARQELAEHGALSSSTLNTQLPTKKQHPLLQDTDSRIKPDRYEWFLYLQIPSRMNGQLTLPDIIKYRDLDADLLSRQRWKNEKEQLIEQSQLPKIAAKPKQLIEQMVSQLNDRLHSVSDFLEKSDNRNIILRNRKGKRVWRLSSGSKKTMVNNPFFQQMPTTGIADMLRMVDRETGFLKRFDHILSMPSHSQLHEHDLLAILVGNATNQGIYGISQISDRTYDQLRTIQANYLRLETLDAANDCINNATAQLPIFKHYNIQDDIIHASTDGQKFEARRETFKTRYSSKYFGTQKGVSAMTLIANHAAINARVIGANEGVNNSV